MCAVSYVGDYWKQTFPERHPSYPVEYDLESLRKEIKELKELLKAAKKYDEAMGEPDCEVDEKVKLIKQLAKEVGVDLEGIL